MDLSSVGKKENIHCKIASEIFFVAFKCHKIREGGTSRIFEILV